MPLPVADYPRGPRASLREFHIDDLPAWQRIAGDPLVAAHTPWPALATPDAAAAWIHETQRVAALAPRRNFYLGIEQYGADLVGSATLDVVSIPHLQGEIGCFLRPDRWGEGLGTEVARLLLELAFTRLGLHRVQAMVDPANVAAKRVMEHVNMRQEGTLLDRFMVDGQWRDRDVYAITMPEWRGQPRRVAPAAAIPDPPTEPAEDVPAPLEGIVMLSTDLEAVLEADLDVTLVVDLDTVLEDGPEVAEPDQQIIR